MKVWIVETGQNGYSDDGPKEIIGVFDRRPTVDEVLEMVAAKSEETSWMDWVTVFPLEVTPIKFPTRCIDNPEPLVFKREWVRGAKMEDCAWKREK